MWPSCQRNSRVRRKGSKEEVVVSDKARGEGERDERGFLNSQRTTEFHWFSLRGKSRWDRIHCDARVMSAGT